MYKNNNIFYEDYTCKKRCREVDFYFINKLRGIFNDRVQSETNSDKNTITFSSTYSNDINKVIKMIKNFDK